MRDRLALISLQAAPFNWLFVAVSSVASSKTSSKSSSKSVYARSYVDSSYFEPRDDRRDDREPLDDGFDDRLEEDPPENETERPRSVRRFGILGFGEVPDIEVRLNLTSWLYHLFRISRFSNLNSKVEHLSVHMIPTAPPNLTRLSFTISPN